MGSRVGCKDSIAGDTGGRSSCKGQGRAGADQPPTLTNLQRMQTC